MVWARALPTHPPHRLVVGGQNGHGFSREENSWFLTAGRPRGRALLSLMYALWRCELRLRLHSCGVPLGGCPVPLCAPVLYCANTASKKAKVLRAVLCAGRTEGGGECSRSIRLVGTKTCTASAGNTTHKTTFIRITSVVSHLRNASVPCGHDLTISSATCTTTHEHEPATARHHTWCTLLGSGGPQCHTLKRTHCETKICPSPLYQYPPIGGQGDTPLRYNVAQIAGQPRLQNTGPQPAVPAFVLKMSCRDFATTKSTLD